MASKLEQSLLRHFDRHRIVFWYDRERKLRAQFDSVDLDEIKKIVLDNNEYAVKYKVLREEPDQKFLIYYEGKPPQDTDNWLLDVQLAYGEFRTDQIAFWLDEMNLSPDFATLVQDYTSFFAQKENRTTFRARLKPTDTTYQMKTLMLAICSKSEERFESVLESLLLEMSEESNRRWQEIIKCELEQFFWEQMQRYYNYSADNASLQDFSYVLFKDCYAMAVGGSFVLNNEALIFLKRWMDSVKFRSSFEKISCDAADVLNIEADLLKRDASDLIEIDYFELIDKKIVYELVSAVVNRTININQLQKWLMIRRQSYWYDRYQSLYEAIEQASMLFQMISESNINISSPSEGISLYTEAWYKIDQCYRKFIYNVQSSSQATLMSSLTEQVENHYVNNYLLQLGDKWQSVVDHESKWSASPYTLQNKFFSNYVKPFIDKSNKVCVLISDGMRYEIGEELLTLIRREDRFSGELEPMLAMLPSYTQLGMAALLPGNDLTIEATNNLASVKKAGQLTNGIENRRKILQSAHPSSTALQAKNFMDMRGEEVRNLVRDHDVIYIYHNHIDAIGHDTKSENRAFLAVEETIQELIKMIKKLTGNNVNNIVLTTDHGFLYQHRKIDESDFALTDTSGNEILHKDRRFVIGTGLKANDSLKLYKAEDVGLQGSLEIQIPKSINRLRLSGACMQFVHGGASLQETVLPVLKINKKRQSDVSWVDVEILRGTTNTITSGQLALKLYQSQPVSDKLQPRLLRIGIYTESNELISNSDEYLFDITSENARDREVVVKLLLTQKADFNNNQEVILRLDEKIAGTNQYREYKAIRYQLRRSFTSDFDF